MAYIGPVRPTETSSTIVRDPFTGDGSTVAFNLSIAPINEQHVFVTINGVVQHDSAYTVSGTTLTFSNPPANGDAIEVRIISQVGVGYLPPPNSIQSTHLAPQSITRSKLENFGFNSPRNEVLIGRTDTNGFPNCLEVGTGFTVDFKGATTPALLSFANGFDSLGAIDYVSTIDTDVGAAWTLPANNHSYLYVERNSSTGALTYGSTLVEPQIGEVFDSSKHSLLHFNGVNASTVFTDEFGRSWTAIGNAQLTTTTPIFGSASVLFDGTGDGIKAPINTLGRRPWTIEFFFRFASLPASGAIQSLVMVTRNGFGVQLNLYNNAGTIRTQLTLSSDGSTTDIAAGVVGTSTTWDTTTDNHFALVFTGTQYVLYVNGTADITVSSSRVICPVSNIHLGLHSDETSNPSNGRLDEFRMTLGTARYVSSFVKPSSAFTPDVFWFNRTTAKMNFGSPSSWTQRQVVFVGEGKTNGSTVGNLYNYFYKKSTIKNIEVAHGILKASQSVANGTSWVPVVYEKQKDLFSWFDGTNFTPKIKGRYLILSGVRYGGSPDGTEVAGAIVLNGSHSVQSQLDSYFNSQQHLAGDASSSPSLNLVLEAELNGTTDYVTVVTVHAHTAALSLNTQPSSNYVRFIYLGE